MIYSSRHSAVVLELLILVSKIELNMYFNIGSVYLELVKL